MLSRLPLPLRRLASRVLNASSRVHLIAILSGFIPLRVFLSLRTGITQDGDEYAVEAELAQGFTFQIPDAGLAIAVAVFGITGVGATELYIYTYWCVEKGYARYTGPREDTEAWRRRARGWVHVMNFDVIGSMIIYTIATVAFYLLGAGILNKMGLVPEGKEMIATLTNIYTQTYGEWSKWLFYLGAIVILFGTIIAATAGHSRMFADFMRLQGTFRKDDFKARSRWRDIFIVILVLIPVIFYFIFGQAPVKLVVWGAITQAMMLPIISFATVYLIQRHLPPELKAPAWLTGLLWLCAIVITGFVVPALLSEAKKLF